MAMEEIKIILAKHDIAASVVLHTPGHSEFLVKVNPSYSCAKLENDRFVVKIKASHYNDDKIARDKIVADTSNMMMHLAGSTGNLAQNLYQMSNSLDRAVNAEHTSGETSSHTQQNN
jgi:hypothetical protein